MSDQWRARLLVASVLIVLGGREAAAMKLDERPAGPGEWGFRPAQDSTSPVTPPSFSWRPQRGIVSWELEVYSLGKTGEADPKKVYYMNGVEFNVHCPPKVFPASVYSWRYRGLDKNGRPTNWSKPRAFLIAKDAAKLPLPLRDELLARIPKQHPRLFVRPEQMRQLHALAHGRLRKQFNDMVRECDKLLKKPPPTKEPPKYPEGTKRGSDPWRKIWWGNRRYVQKALNGAATLAFTRLLGGKEDYGRLAKRILLDCAKWDPKGSTGYRYNDEAGMPHNYYFSRTYTFVNDLLTEEERDICRRVMKIRGDEMYRHLCPRHLWKPYSSHSNRAWHFLGEVGIAFLDEVEGADDWAWFAANVFFNCYPVWSDADGGWHEGMQYWRGYQNRFTWWADVMRAAMELNAFDKPYYSQVGYYAMYLAPPGKRGGGFGDLTAHRKAEDNVELVSTFASQAQNGHWAWYVSRMGGPKSEGGYIGFVRGVMPIPVPRPPKDLPPSRVFRGTGQAFLNTQIEDARESVQVVFKSSPFGTQSHGYEANNSFLLWAYGKRLLIRSGRRDSYGSEHHKRWMWSTRSVNCITVDGQGQLPRSAAATSEIVSFKTGRTIDIVVGEAGSAYRAEDGKTRTLDRFTRTVVFIKPELVVVYDRLVAREPATFEYWLHAIKKFDENGQHNIRASNGNVYVEIDFLAPEGLTFRQTDEYDPNPRPRIKLREWHLTATTPAKAKRLEFVTLFRPHRKTTMAPTAAELKQVRGGYVLKTALTDGLATILLPTDDRAALRAGKLRSRGAVAVERRGRVTETVRLDEQTGR